MVLPTDTVMHYNQEVCAVIATERYIAADGAAVVVVDYEELKPVIDAHKATDPDMPILRTDKGKAIARFGTKSQGQGHETTYAQIIAQELGIPALDIQIEEGDTDTAPYGLGTYGSRSTPVAGAAAAVAARKLRDKARKIAAYLLEVSEEDLEWEPGKFSVKGVPEKSKTIQEIVFAAYTIHPPGMEAGFEVAHYYDPPNLTFPFGSYICVVDIDNETGGIKVRRFVAIDDLRNDYQSDDCSRTSAWRFDTRFGTCHVRRIDL